MKKRADIVAFTIIIVLLGLSLLSYSKFSWPNLIKASPLLLLTFLSLVLERPKGNLLTGSQARFLATSLLLPLALIFPLFIAAFGFAAVFLLAQLILVREEDWWFALAQNLAALTLANFAYQWLSLSTFFQDNLGLAGFIALLLYFFIFVGMRGLFDSVEQPNLLKFRVAFLNQLHWIGQETALFLLLGFLFFALCQTLSYWAFLVYLLGAGAYVVWLKWYESSKRERSLFLLVGKLLAGDERAQNRLKVVTDLAKKLGFSMGLYGKKLEDLLQAAYLQDVGESGIDRYSLDFILEREEASDGIPLHARIGGEALLKVQGLDKVGEIVLKHHQPFFHHKKRTSERGKIPLAARILAVVSAYEAMINDDKNPLIPEEAFRSIRKEQGFLYDPKVVRNFKRVLLQEKAFTRRHYLS